MKDHYTWRIEISQALVGLGINPNIAEPAAAELVERQSEREALVCAFELPGDEGLKKALDRLIEQRETSRSTRRLFPLAEALDLLGIGKTAAYQEMKAGRLRYVQNGSRRLIPDNAINDYIELLEAEHG